MPLHSEARKEDEKGKGNKEKPPKPEPEHMFDIRYVQKGHNASSINVRAKCSKLSAPPRFVHTPKDEDGVIKRSSMHSSIIYINTAHPDFVTRAGGTSAGMVCVYCRWLEPYSQRPNADSRLLVDNDEGKRMWREQQCPGVLTLVRFVAGPQYRHSFS